MNTTSNGAADEETPLLQDRPQRKTPSSQEQPQQKTPLPWFQLSLVILLQLGESLTSQVISPFAPQLVRELRITGGEESKVGYYVGMILSIFFITEGCTVLFWSQLSDRVGRKPAILIGIFGLSLSMFCFGMSTTFLGALTSRALNGALNGNIAVMKSLVAELSDSTNIARAFAYNSLAWASGATLGPLIGGTLSHPAERFPLVFGNSSFLKKYPYFLPCAIPATYSACAWLIAYIFLKETVPQSMPFRELIFKSARKTRPHQNPPVVINGNTDKPLPLKSLLVFPVIITGVNYALLAFLEIAFRAIQPLFLSTPVEHGGLGLPPSAIGKILSLYGILNGFSQIFFFSRVNDRWGSKRVFLAGITVLIPLYLLFPVIRYLASIPGFMPVVWVIVVVQVALSVLTNFGYGAIAILIAAASPNKASVGATNGLCQVAVSLSRGLGPGIATSLFSLSMAHEWLGGYLVYYILALSVAVAVFVASKIPSSL